jgi:hypothetical protein
VGAVSTAVFDAVSLSSTAPNLPGCPSGWTCADVGNPTPAGSQSLSGGTWSVQGGGGDIWGTSDQFHYVFHTLAGDGASTAHLTSQTNTSPWAKAGVMLRQTTDPGAPYYAALVTPSNGIVVQYRTAQGGSAAQAVQATGTTPAYLRVSRAGGTYAASTSADGTTWTVLPGSTVNLGVTGGVLAGLAVTSHNTSAPCTAVFDTVS